MERDSVLPDIWGETMRSLIAAALVALVLTPVSAQVSIPSIPNIAAMQALGAASSQYESVMVQNYVSNGGGGIFDWNPTSTATPDSCTIFQATGVVTGRWLRQETGQPISPDQCGLVSGLAGDAAWNAWTAYLNSKHTAGAIHSGTWILGTPQVFSYGAAIICDDEQGTVIDFEPTVSPATAFTWSEGASSVDFPYWKGCQFRSSKTTTKTVFNLIDTRGGELSFFNIAQGEWPGSDSIGLQTNGRDTLSVHDYKVLTARPFVFGINPNFSSLNTDHFHFWNGEAGSTLASGGKAYEILNGVNISQLTFDGYEACELGDYCLYWNDNASTIASNGLVVRNMRTEQGATPSAYSIDLESTAQNLQTFICDSCVLDSARNGLKTVNVLSVTLRDGLYAGMGTGLNLTGKSGTVVNLENFFQQTGSTDTLANLIWISGTVPQLSASPAGENTTWVFLSGATGGHTRTVAQLPGCSASTAAQKFMVRDATMSQGGGIGTVVAGGGTNIVSVGCNTVNWIIGG